MDDIKYRVKWNREETILAFELYCRVPFSRIEKGNPQIVELAKLLGRTPSSVSMKMANIAACDPAVLSRNLHGMSNGSKLDREIFNEFSDNMENLSVEAQRIKASYTDISNESILGELDIDILPEGIDRQQLSNARVGQAYFRLAVLNAYGGKCCVTGLNSGILLRASHIKPWKDSDVKTERTNPRNGLCLNPFHDVAFDKGLITIDSSYKIITSCALKEVDMDRDTREWMMSYDGQRISLPERFLPAKEFIEYHNDMIFLG